MEPIEELSADLSWRETELALIKIFLQKRDVSEKQHSVLSRAAWGLLYAHYEGYSKFCLTLYYDRASKIVSSCNPLPPKTKEFALQAEIKRLRNLPTSEFLVAVESFSDSSINVPPSFPAVDTKSNLWPNVLEELLAIADIQCPAVDRNRHHLRSLVDTRNGIAHGGNTPAAYKDYLARENAVYQVLYELSYAVNDRLKCPPFA